MHWWYIVLTESVDRKTDKHTYRQTDRHMLMITIPHGPFGLRDKNACKRSGDRAYKLAIMCQCMPAQATVIGSWAEWYHSVTTLACPSFLPQTSGQPQINQIKSLIGIIFIIQAWLLGGMDLFSRHMTHTGGSTAPVHSLQYHTILQSIML